MMPFISRTIVTAALVATTAGCASTNEADPTLYETATERPTVVEVTNDNWADMNVYVIRHSVERRIGFVPGSMTRRLEIPPEWVSAGTDLRLMVDPVGGGQTHRTGPILVAPGDRIEFRVENHLAMSTYSVVRR